MEVDGAALEEVEDVVIFPGADHQFPAGHLFRVEDGYQRLPLGYGQRRLQFGPGFEGGFPVTAVFLTLDLLAEVHRLVEGHGVDLQQPIAQPLRQGIIARLDCHLGLFEEVAGRLVDVALLQQPPHLFLDTMQGDHGILPALRVLVENHLVGSPHSALAPVTQLRLHIAQSLFDLQGQLPAAAAIFIIQFAQHLHPGDTGKGLEDGDAAADDALAVAGSEPLTPAKQLQGGSDDSALVETVLAEQLKHLGLELFGDAVQRMQQAFTELLAGEFDDTAHRLVLHANVFVAEVTGNQLVALIVGRLAEHEEDIAQHRPWPFGEKEFLNCRKQRLAIGGEKLKKREALPAAGAGQQAVQDQIAGALAEHEEDFFEQGLAIVGGEIAIGEAQHDAMVGETSQNLPGEASQGRAFFQLTEADGMQQVDDLLRFLPQLFFEQPPGKLLNALQHHYRAGRHLPFRLQPAGEAVQHEEDGAAVIAYIIMFTRLGEYHQRSLAEAQLLALGSLAKGDEQSAQQLPVDFASIEKVFDEVGDTLVVLEYLRAFGKQLLKIEFEPLHPSPLLGLADCRTQRVEGFVAGVLAVFH